MRISVKFSTQRPTGKFPANCSPNQSVATVLVAFPEVSLVVEDEPDHVVAACGNSMVRVPNDVVSHLGVPQTFLCGHHQSSVTELT
jgi:hypothetical protein